MKNHRPALYSLDPRYFQLTVLGLLLVYGLALLRFDLELTAVFVALATVLAVQYLCSRAVQIGFEPKSALISGLSLCLLLRANSQWLIVIAAVLTIASKFCLRVRGKHLFNPTNFGIGVLLLLSDGVWVSPGQWGSLAIFASFVACLGYLVVRRAARSDVTFAFLAFYALFLFFRAWYLGDPPSIPFHQLESGALLIFSFFMISDPKTTPDSRRGRILFALLVALGAYYLRFFATTRMHLFFPFYLSPCLRR